MNTDAYTQFKLAFLDQVALKGYDADFIEGFFKRAEDEYARWEQLIGTTYKGDRALCKRAYTEAALALDIQATEKRAEGGLGPEILGFLDQFGGNIGQMFGQQAGSGLGGAVAGGGGGMLIGLLLSQLFDIPLPIAMMLGALGGGALGYSAAGTPSGRENVFGVKPPGSPGLGELRRMEGQEGASAATPTPQPQAEPPPASAAANGVAQGQAVSNAAAAGAPPTPQGPAAGQPSQAKPIVPPPQQQQQPPPAPAPGANNPIAPLGPPGPVTPPPAGGGMPTIKPPERK